MDDVFSISFDIDAVFQNEPLSHVQNRSIAWFFSRTVRYDIFDSHVLHFSVMTIDYSTRIGTSTNASNRPSSGPSGSTNRRTIEC
jgi:hypothetical protein